MERRDFMRSLPVLAAGYSLASLPTVKARTIEAAFTEAASKVGCKMSEYRVLRKGHRDGFSWEKADPPDDKNLTASLYYCDALMEMDGETKCIAVSGIEEAALGEVDHEKYNDLVHGVAEGLRCAFRLGRYGRADRRRKVKTS